MRAGFRPSPVLNEWVTLPSSINYCAIMKPSEVLKQHREDISRIVERNDARNPRVFGSAARGDDTEGSDLDLLVDPIEGKTTLRSLARIKMEIESLLEIPIDIHTPLSLPERFRNTVLREAIRV